MKTLVIAAIVFALSLPFGIRKQTQFRKERIRQLAERIGISNLFDQSKATAFNQVVRRLTYIVADIHGRADRFHEILDNIHFSDSDQLYILGDVIDRNPDGLIILCEIMSADNMHMLLGNHEYMMINAIDDPGYQINQWFTNLDLWYLNGGAVTEMAYNELNAEKQNEIIEYIKKLPLNIETICNGKQYLLVHGSPASKYKEGVGQYVDKTEYAVWNRFDPQADEFDPDITLICGHTPTIHLSPKKPMEVFHSSNIWYIDCGCAYPTSEGGRLACLCLETGCVCYSTL